MTETWNEITSRNAMTGRIIFLNKQKLLAADAAQIINTAALGYNPEAD